MQKNIVRLIVRRLVNFCLLLLFWVMLSGYHWHSIVLGSIVSISAYLLFHSRLRVMDPLKYSLSSLIGLVGFLGIFLYNLLKSNFDVASRVIKPHLPISPGIIEVKTSLSSDIAKMMLSYAITLTPGTLVIESIGESIFIHCIDVHAQTEKGGAERTIRTYERWLQRMFV